MKKILSLLTMAIMLVSGPVKAQTVNDLIFYTEEYPPYNYQAIDGSATGITVDLLDAVLKKLGSTKTAADVKLTTWDEGYNAALNNNNTVIFGTTRSAAREPLFKWAGPIMASKTAIIANKDSKVKLVNNDDLKNHKVAVIKNDIGHQLASAAGVPDSSLVVASTLPEVYAALKDGKADFWVYEEAVAKWFLSSEGVGYQYDTVGVLAANDLSYAFNKGVPDSVVAAVQNAIDELKASGELAKIIANYQK